jgi:hypothetical protein
VLAFSGLNSLAPSAPVRRRSTVARVSEAAISLGLASRRSSCLATSRPRHARCVRPTSVSHHTLRAPASRGFLSRREVALARSRGAGVSRCHLRFGGPFALSTSGDSPPVTPTKDRTSDTPVASPSVKRWRSRTHRFVRGRRDRFCRAFVKRAQFHDPKCLPSAGGSISRRAAATCHRRRRATDLTFDTVSWLCHHDPILAASSRAAAFDRWISRSFGLD